MSAGDANGASAGIRLHLRRTRIAVIDKLRLAFERRGFDVRPYSNNQVATALRHAAAETDGYQDRFVCAFRRLHLSNPPRGEPD